MKLLPTSLRQLPGDLGEPDTEGLAHRLLPMSIGVLRSRLCLHLSGAVLLLLAQRAAGRLSEHRLGRPCCRGEEDKLKTSFNPLDGRDCKVNSQVTY